MHRGVEAFDQGLQATAGADGGQLAGIADHDHLGARRPGCLQEGEQRSVVGHGRLVEHGDVTGRQPQAVVGDAPVE